MGGARGVATTRDGKAAKIELVQDLLEKTEMLFSVPASSLNVKQVQTLRRSLPEGTTMSVVKNKLMARAMEGKGFEGTETLLKGANMWFFIEEDIGGTVKAFSAFTKENDKKESHTILGGIIDGSPVDGKQVDAISKLPSKLELYAKIAGGIKAVPTKLARATKATPSKLARAIKLATETNEGGE